MLKFVQVRGSECMTFSTGWFVQRRETFIRGLKGTVNEKAVSFLGAVDLITKD